ncbi:MAG: hypothetical protein ABFC96_07475 [Thermoguttaceae bacterium]
MQHRRRPRPGPSVALFPFLAVLICTMGALVPLLMAVSRTARSQAEAAAKAKAQEQVARMAGELQTAQEDVKWRIEKLKDSRRKTQSQLDDARLELGHFEEHSRELRSRIERCREAMTNLDRLEQGSGQQEAQSTADVQRLRGQIETAKRDLDEARRMAATRKRSFAVVPYEGPNQTHRRPIYIECRGDAVVLQPEGVRLSAADFDGPLGPGNPMAAALRAAREYLRAAQEIDPQVGEPYPMLLVRPDGIVAFYAARAAMKSWGSEFGYELIGDDWKIAYQPPDPKLADIYRQVIAGGRESEARLAASAPRQYGRSRIRRSEERDFGDGVPSSGVAHGERGDGSGGATGFGDQDAGGAMVGGAPGQGGFGASGAAPSATPVGSQGLGYASATPAGDRGLGTSVPSGGSDTPAGSFADGPALAGPRRMSSVGNPDAAITGRSAGGDGYESGRGMGPAAATSSAAYGSSVGGAPDGVQRGPGYASPTGPRLSDPGAGQTATGVARSGNSTNGDGNSDRPEGYVAGRPAREQPASPLRGDDSSTAQITRGNALRPGEWEPTPDMPDRPEKKDDFAAQKRNRHENTRIDRSGDDWALRSASRGSVGLTRPIRIECYADRLVVLSDRGPSNSRVVRLGARTDSSIDTLVSAIWEQMEGWGMAGRGMYWRPVLQVSVAPDAQQRYTDLARSLEGSGLTVQRR